jgi:hypothetical protein
MENFEAESAANEPEKKEIYPGREAILHHATEEAIKGYLDRLEKASNESGGTFIGTDGKEHESRHVADEHVIDMVRQAGISRTIAAEAAERNDYYIEGVAHDIEEIHESLGVVTRRLGKLFDRNPEATRRFAETLPDIRSL